MGKRGVIAAVVAGCLATAGATGPASVAAGFVPSQTRWNVEAASGKIVWTLESVPFNYLGFRSASGEITERWHYLGHGPVIWFPFTTLRPLAPPGSPAMSFPIKPIKGTLTGHASAVKTDGTSGGCSANLSSLPNNFGRDATLSEASLDHHHMAVWVTAEDPTDLLTTEPCATQLGQLGEFPAADPDQHKKPTVHPIPIAALRIDASQRVNRGKIETLHLRAEFDLVVTTSDGRRHVVGDEVSTATVELKLTS